MTHDIHVLMMWILGCLIVAALCTTAFPVLYAFFPWRSTLLGKLFMLQAIAFAVAMDATALFNIWTPANLIFLFWVNVFIFTLIAVSSTLLTAMLWRLNHKNRREVRQAKRRERQEARISKRNLKKEQHG